MGKKCRHLTSENSYLKFKKYLLKSQIDNFYIGKMFEKIAKKVTFTKDCINNKCYLQKTAIFISIEISGFKIILKLIF
jgi:hypothetical protein